MELEALHTGVMTLGEYELPCYVLNNEKRVLAQNKVVTLITGGRESGDLGRYLRAQAIQPLLPAKLQGNYKDNILIFKAGTNMIYGIEGSDIIDICKAYLKARQEGTLSPQQAKLAEQSEMFVMACAKTGIDAIIDEATGYDYFRKAGDLQEKFKAYLQDEYREWTLTFPRQFFNQLYKLEGKVPPINYQPYPKRFGKYVMNFIYDTLDPEIADYLRENNPNPEGKHHHHQLFNDFGYNTLQDHIMSVLGIMKASINLERFNENIAIAFPNTRTRRAIRLNKIREIEEIKPVKNYPVQMTMFDYLPTVNTPEKSDIDDETGEPLSDFNKKLKKALNFNPEKKK
jgi:hypothetical protein